jgi:hypothetical protein
MGRSEMPFSRYFGSDGTQVLAEPDIEFDFRGWSCGIELHSFYEKSAGKRYIVVPRHTAIVGVPSDCSEYVTYLDADQHNICVYESRDSPNYRLVRNALAKFVSTARAGDGTAS